MTVSINDTTTIQKTVTGTMADLQQGDFLTVSGTPDASGNIAATAVSVRAAGQGFPARSPGATPIPRGTSGNATFPNGGAGRGTSGTIASISGNTLTLTTIQGSQVTVNISDTTTIQKTVAGTISDLQAGESLIVMGAPDANGNIIARSISIRPQA